MVVLSSWHYVLVTISETCLFLDPLDLYSNNPLKHQVHLLLQKQPCPQLPGILHLRRPLLTRRTAR